MVLATRNLLQEEDGELYGPFLSI